MCIGVRLAFIYVVVGCGMGEVDSPYTRARGGEVIDLVQPAD